jgi:hypothetical protein
VLLFEARFTRPLLKDYGSFVGKELLVDDWKFFAQRRVKFSMELILPVSQLFS